MLQFSSLNVDRVGGVYLMEYLPGIGQQLVQMIYISPAVNIILYTIWKAGSHKLERLVEKCFVEASYLELVLL